MDLGKKIVKLRERKYSNGGREIFSRGRDTQGKSCKEQKTKTKGQKSFEREEQQMHLGENSSAGVPPAQSLPCCCFQ